MLLSNLLVSTSGIQSFLDKIDSIIWKSWNGKSYLNDQLITLKNCNHSNTDLERRNTYVRK